MEVRNFKLRHRVSSVPQHCRTVKVKRACMSAISTLASEPQIREGDRERREEQMQRKID